MRINDPEPGDRWVHGRPHDTRGAWDHAEYDAGNARSVAFIVLMALVVGGILWVTR